MKLWRRQKRCIACGGERLQRFCANCGTRKGESRKLDQPLILAVETTGDREKFGDGSGLMWRMFCIDQCPDVVMAKAATGLPRKGDCHPKYADYVAEDPIVDKDMDWTQRPAAWRTGQWKARTKYCRTLDKSEARP